MNEMQTFAEGDLTIRATVSEDITGAVADSVNFAIEELRSLVSRITAAADQVTVASDSAQQTTVRMLSDNDKQSQEIKNTSAQVLGCLCGTARRRREPAAARARSQGRDVPLRRRRGRVLPGSMCSRRAGTPPMRRP